MCCEGSTAALQPCAEDLDCINCKPIASKRYDVNEVLHEQMTVRASYCMSAFIVTHVKRLQWYLCINTSVKNMTIFLNFNKKVINLDEK